MFFGVAHAAESERAAGVADFHDVCPVALLAPNRLPAAIKARSLSEKATANPGVRVGATLYASADGSRTVTLTRRHFSDFSMVSCLVSFLEPLSANELDALHMRLEGHSSLGRLEGELIEVTPSLRIGTLKRPGNSPIVTVNITAAATVTTLIMNRWDLMAGK